MKPFTLEWWMTLYTKTCDRIVSNHNVLKYQNIPRTRYIKYHKEDLRDHIELARWIRQRIINKYGE